MIGKGKAQLYRYTEAESPKPVEERAVVNKWQLSPTRTCPFNPTSHFAPSSHKPYVNSMCSYAQHCMSGKNNT
jgi:hypothetical protein